MAATKRSEKGHRWFAAFYSRISERANRRRLAPILRDLLAGLSGEVLEIGAGTGATFEYFPPAAHVIAIEPDPHMRKRAEPRLRPNIELRPGNGESVPVADGSMDAVVVSLVLCTVSDLRGTLAEIRRVLKPGGQLVFIEHVRSGGFAGRLQDVAQPVYGWLSAGCHWNRRTELAIRDAGFRFERIDRWKLSGMRAISGIARPDGT
jgi:SAM-dependent methyltransferase